jgi:hypothetical protein
MRVHQQKRVFNWELWAPVAKIIGIPLITTRYSQGCTIVSMLTLHESFPIMQPLHESFPIMQPLRERSRIVASTTSLLPRNLLPFCTSFAPESSVILHLFCARIFCHFAPLLRPNLLSFCISFAPEPSIILHVFAPEFAHRLYRPLNASLQPH